MTIHKGKEPWPRVCALAAQGGPRGSGRKARERGVCVLGVGRGPPFPRLQPGAPAFPCGPPQARPERRGGPSRASPAPVGFITCLLALLEPPLLLRSCWNQAASSRPAARIHVALHRTRSHSSPLTLITLSHTRAHTYGSAPPGTRAHTSPLTPDSRPERSPCRGAQAPRERAPRGPSASPWLT